MFFFWLVKIIGFGEENDKGRLCCHNIFQVYVKAAQSITIDINLDSVARVISARILHFFPKIFLKDVFTFIGNEYFSNSKKILVIGESHYAPRAKKAAFDWQYKKRSPKSPRD